MDPSLTNGSLSGECACLGCGEDQAVHLKNWLPPGYKYHFCTYRLCTTEGNSHLDHTSFEASLRIALTEICEVKEWVGKLSESSGVSWRVAVTKPNKGQRVLYKAHYRCQHNVYVRSDTANQRRLSKNTCCEAKMVCTLVKTTDKRGGTSRSIDPHIPTYPTSVRLYNVHNHNIFVAEALRHKDVGVKAIETLTQLFEVGHSPTSALAVLKSDLLAEHGNKYVYVSANRAICPDLQFCYRLYQKLKKQEFGEQSGEAMLAALERQVESYNAACNDTCAKLKISSAGTPLVAICSPLMKQTHTLSNSGEMCFMDSSGNMDRENCRVFLLLTHTCAGGLPLGIVITQSEDEKTISEGLELLKSLLKNDAFGGRGEAGPRVFLTDDSKAEKGAIAQVFPEAAQLLCIFHLLQAVWRWLWNKEHEVEMKDRQTMFSIVKDMLYAREMSTVELLYQQALDNPLTTRYRKFLTYLQNLYSRRESWALSYRRDLPTRGNQTNNYVEAAMRVLKDKILHRTKAFNLPQLFNLFITRLEMYYEARVTDVALGHWEAFHRSRFLATQSNIKASDISQVGEKKFQVRSSTLGHTYTVDMELELCTCPVGHSGAPCKHQAAVVQNYNITSINFLLTTAEMRAELLKITKASVSLDFLNPLRQYANAKHISSR
ncbi:uncharacterized protein LOC113040739 [Carassius auratus]|uniref:Uncharacterized protein LOC113040739 n=1 Tax=Carassius auratus TaxID=7957 RepID=A0A6P6J3V6_CARAU|nr:uncharacterized protein LOC113040739 [Carassius auratus]